MPSITLEQASADLPGLIAQVRAGQQFTIIDGDQPVALVSAAPSPTEVSDDELFNPPIPGRFPLAGMLKKPLIMSSDFDEPLEEFKPYTE